MLEFASQCCDADYYLQGGEQCAANIRKCWGRLRPIGITLYFSIPFRLSIPAETIVVMNFILIALSVTLLALAIHRAAGAPRRNVPRLSSWLAAAVPHLLFILKPARSSLSDGPAACLVLFALSLMILGVRSRRTSLVVLSALCTSLAALTRVFYFYPALIAMVALALLCLLRQRFLAFVLASAVFAAPVLTQFTLTYKNTGAWSFIDAEQAAKWQQTHLSSTTTGYDTLLPARGHHYPADPPGDREGGILCAASSGQIGAIVSLLAQRTYFYLGSYTAFNSVYLFSPSERFFSPWILVLNSLFFALGIVAVRSGPDRAPYLAPTIFLAAAWGEALLIIPEARFIMALQTFVWGFGFWGLYLLITRPRSSE